MPVQTAQCFEVICDNAGQAFCDGGWDEGAPHFPSVTEATDYATKYAGFVITGTTVLCDHCAARRDCDRLGHQWAEWNESEYLGVRFERRFCDHCGTGEYSPEFQQAVLLREAADTIDTAAWQIEREGRDV